MSIRNTLRGTTLAKMALPVLATVVLAVVAVPASAHFMLRGKVLSAQNDLLALAAKVQEHQQGRGYYHEDVLAGADALQATFAGWSPTSNAVDFAFSYTPRAGGFQLTATGVMGPLMNCDITIGVGDTRTRSGCPDVGRVLW